MNAIFQAAPWLQTVGVLAVEVTLVVLLAYLVEKAFAHTHSRRTVWQAALCALALVIVAELSGLGRGAATWVRDHAVPVLVGNPPPVTPVQVLPPAPMQDATHFSKSTSPIAESPSSAAPAPGDAPTAPVGFSEALPGVAIPPVVIPIPAWPAWAVGLWVFGAAVLGLRALLARGLLLYFAWRHSTPAPEVTSRRVQMLAALLGFRLRVLVFESARLSSPIAFGVVRARIGLPRRFDTLFNAREQDAMLAHELGHLGARDTAWYLLADLVTAALCWHPFVWLARRRLHTLSEAAADEASLVVADGPGVLAECLVKLGAQLAPPPPLAGIGVIGSTFRSGLGRRVERLMGLQGRTWAPPGRVRLMLARAAGVGVLVMTVLLCTAWMQPRPRETHETFAQSLRGGWKQSPVALALVSAVGTDNPFELLRQVPTAEPVAVVARAERNATSQFADPPAEPKRPAPPLLQPTLPPKVVPEKPGETKAARIEVLTKEFNQLKRSHDENAKVYLPRHPKMVALQRQIDQVNLALAELRGPAGQPSVPKSPPPLPEPTKPEPKQNSGVNTDDKAADIAIRLTEEEAHRRASIAQQLSLNLLYAQRVHKQSNLTNAATLYEGCILLTRQLNGLNVEAPLKQSLSGLTSVRIALAYQYLERGEFKKADEEADKLLFFDPANTTAKEFKEFNKAVQERQVSLPRKPVEAATAAETKTKVALMVQDARVHYQARRYKEAEDILKDALKLDPYNSLAYYYLRLILEARFDDELRKQDQTYNERVLEVKQLWNKKIQGDLPVPNQYYRTNSEVPWQVYNSKGRQRILAKMEQIVFPEVSFDGLPLNEVVKIIADDTKKYDPEKKGINYLLNSIILEDPPLSAAGALGRGGQPTPPLLDAAGNPIAPAGGAGLTRIDLDKVIVRVTPPLKNLTLAQVLDLVIKAADKPIKFSIEDYAIMFTQRLPEHANLYTRIFRVDTNTFMQALTSVIAIPVTPVKSSAGVNVGGAGGGQPGVISTNLTSSASLLVRDFFLAAGVNLGTSASSPTQVFFNDRNGMLMVRASLIDLDIIQQAVELLNMTPANQPDAPKALPLPSKGQPAVPLTPESFRANADVAWRGLPSIGRQQILSKMEKIVFPEVSFDGLPLNEVVKMIHGETIRFDPDKKGLSFMLNHQLLDPPAGTKAIDLDTVIVKTAKPLKDQTLAQVLDAVVKAADKPVKFSVEDYAIMFTQRVPEPEPVLTRMFRVDVERLVKSLPAATPAEVGTNAAVQVRMRKLLTNAGVKRLTGTNPLPTQVFFNDRNGMLMIRGTEAEVQAVEKELKRLNLLVNPLPPPNPEPASAPKQQPQSGLNGETDAGVPTADASRRVPALPAGTQPVLFASLADPPAKQPDAPKALPPAPTPQRGPPAVPVPNQYYRTNSEVPNMVHTTKGRRAILHKLNLIRFDEVFFDGVPLPEVVKFLSDETRKRDPERKGLNFLVNSNIRDNPRLGATTTPPGGPPAPQLDAAGNPIAPAAAPAQSLDLDNVLIKTSLPVRDVTLAQLLDLLVKCADQPIRVSVEDYAVVFVVNNSESPPLFTRAFRVDPNTFVQGLQGVTFIPVTPITPPGQGGAGGGAGGGGGAGFGVGGVPPGGGGGGGGQTGGGVSGGGLQLQSVTVPTKQTNAAGIVQNFFRNAGVKSLGRTNSGARVTYDSKTGMVVVRAPQRELDAAQGAVEQVKRGEKTITVPLPATPPPTQPAKKSSSISPAGGQQAPAAPAATQVLVQARFVELTDAACRELGFDRFRAAASGATNAPVRTNATALGLDATNRVEVAVVAGSKVTGVLTAEQFEETVRKMERTVGIDLLAAPRVVTLDRRMAEVGVVWHEAIGSTAGAPTVTLGTVLRVNPNVLEDTKSIQLECEGSLTRRASSSAGVSGITPPIPAFLVRQFTTTNTVLDGQTIIFAGGERDENTRVRAKTPILGDVPLLGRLFRTESELKERRHLLIFVTATIVNDKGEPVNAEKR